MAMTIMTIGAAAVMSMQKTSIQGNLDARKSDIANSIARTWVDRLQRDAMQWTLPNTDNPGLSNFANALLLSQGTAAGGWTLPSAYLGLTSPETASYAFDILGRDLPATEIAKETVFCVNYRLQWLVPQSLPLEPGLIRADIRVIWPRSVTPSVGAPGDPGPGWCSLTLANQPNPDLTYTQYHQLYLTTDIRQGAQ